MTGGKAKIQTCAEKSLIEVRRKRECFMDFQQFGPF